MVVWLWWLVVGDVFMFAVKVCLIVECWFLLLDLHWVIVLLVSIHTLLLDVVCLWLSLWHSLFVWCLWLFVYCGYFGVWLLYLLWVWLCFVISLCCLCLVLWVDVFVITVVLFGSGWVVCLFNSVVYLQFCILYCWLFIIYLACDVVYCYCVLLRFRWCLNLDYLFCVIFVCLLLCCTVDILVFFVCWFGYCWSCWCWWFVFLLIIVYLWV